MHLLPTQRRRRGAVTLETAFTYSVVLLLLLGLIVGGLGIFRYHQVAYLSREAARYACVRGTHYQNEVPGATAASANDIYNKVIAPRATSMDPQRLSYKVTWNPDNQPYHLNDDGTVVGHTVTVSVTYVWMPEIFFVGPITLQSSSTMPISY